MPDLRKVVVRGYGLSSIRTSVTIDGVEIPGIRSVVIQNEAGSARVLKLEILHFDAIIDSTTPVTPDA